ncbi:MAG: response regulator transcription factor [Bacteroidota bacterium]
MMEKTFLGSKTSIVVVEDHDLVRKGIISLLSKEPGFKVIGEAENGKECLELLKTTKPDIVLMDIEMPVMDGRQALRIINRRDPDIKVIMLTIRNDEATMAEFIASGARAFMTKNSSDQALFKAIREVQKEGHYFGKTVATAMFKTLQNDRQLGAVGHKMALTKREIEVLKNICNGKSNKEIAASLSIEAGTVNFHRVNLYRKTKSHNITDLIKFGFRNAIISLSE